jgi:hypothetical protein
MAIKRATKANSTHASLLSSHAVLGRPDQECCGLLVYELNLAQGNDLAVLVETSNVVLGS